MVNEIEDAVEAKDNVAELGRDAEDNLFSSLPSVETASSPIDIVGKFFTLEKGGGVGGGYTWRH